MWSLLFSGVSLILIELGILFYRHGARGPGIIFSLVGIIFLLLEILFFLPTLVRNALKNSSFVILFRVTTPGFFYIILIFFIALAAINTGNNLLYLLLSFLIAAIIVSGIISRISLINLQVSVDYQDAIFAGEYTTYRLRTINKKKWFPSFSIGVEGFLTNVTWLSACRPDWIQKSRLDEKHMISLGVPYLRTVAYFPIIQAGCSDVQVFKVRFSNRGLYRIVEIKVSTSFPFGFFRKGKRLRAPGELIVFPAPVDETDFQSYMEEQTDTTPILRKGLGTELYMLREYFPGEDARHIHWKASARSNQTIVKEFAVEMSPGFVFLVDETVAEEPAAYWDHYERIISFLSSLILKLHDSGKSVQMLLSHSTDQPSHQRRDIHALLGGLSISYPRQLSEDVRKHPFNQTAPHDLILPEWHGWVTLCSFHKPDAFPQLAPYIDNYLDFNKIGL